MNALKLVSINRGFDPRDFTMVAFGGGGAMHASALALELNIPRVIVPAHAAVFSAWGMLMSDLRRDYIRTKPTTLTDAVTAEIVATYDEMETEATTAYKAEEVATKRVRFERFADMRYAGQEHTVQIPVSADLTASQGVTQLTAAFADEYEHKFGYRLENDVEVVSYYLVAYATVDRPQLKPIPAGGDLEQARKPARDVDFDTAGVHRTDIYDREKLRAGDQFHGPAIIEESGGTTVVFPAQAVQVDDFGNLHITRSESVNLSAAN